MKVGFFEFYHDQKVPLPPVEKADLSGKTIIVTGANLGIGYETAKHFARMLPGRIILACRNQQKGEAALAKLEQETGYTNAELWLLDLADFSSVKAFADKFEKDGGRLDILVENAAVDVGKKLEFTRDGWETSVQVNDLATSLLALLLLPRMLDTAENFTATPRIIVVSSVLHYMTKLKKSMLASPNPFRKYAHKDEKPKLDKNRYHNTKLLNVFFVRALNDRLQKKPVIVTSVHPGYCYSGLRRSFKGVQAFADSLMEKALARTSEQGSRQLVWAAVGSSDKPDKLRGGYINLSKVVEPSDSVISKDGQIAQDKLWDSLIEELTKVEPKVAKIVQENLTAPAPAKSKPMAMASEKTKTKTKTKTKA